MVLIGGRGLGAVEAEGIRCTAGISGFVQEIGIVEEKAVGIAVYARRVGLGFEFGFARRIGRVGIRAEVVVERDVFPKDDNNMLNGG